MTPATLDYLLRLALREKAAAALELVNTGDEAAPEWGEAAAAVRELLEMRQRAA